jgi:hypothetical protein
MKEIWKLFLLALSAFFLRISFEVARGHHATDVVTAYRSLGDAKRAEIA